MDAGIASQENIDYLIENSYEYLVVSRKRNKCLTKINDIKLD
ncbi:MAG: hypothetical protein Q9M43_14880 [Sulfurimonas sp.]|nr:hypothetical protein [Sulfurimonas sp.]